MSASAARPQTAFRRLDFKSPLSFLFSLQIRCLGAKPSLSRKLCPGVGRILERGARGRACLCFFIFFCSCLRHRHAAVHSPPHFVNPPFCDWQQMWPILYVSPFVL